MKKDKVFIEAQRIMSEVIKALGSSFSLQAMIKWVSKRRGKRIVTIEHFISTDTMGLCLSCVDFDLVVIVPGLDTATYWLAMLHELVHLLLNHAKYEHITYRQFKRTDISGYAFIAKKADISTEGDQTEESSIYTKYEEDIAESVASLLMQCIERYERGGISESARQIFDL